MSREVVYDPEQHGTHCRCGISLATLDAGHPAVSVFVDEVYGEAHCSEACLVDTEAEVRRLDDERDGRHALLREVAR